MKKFEYRREVVEPEGEDSLETTVLRVLNMLGKVGWQLCLIDTASGASELYLMREAPKKKKKVLKKKR